MKVIIDADACPVTREAISVARERGLEVVVVANTAQNLEKYASRKGVEAIQVSSGGDAADFAIVERLRPYDVVVTQDIGLAAMVIGKGAKALSPRGRVFSRATIDMDMLIRHEEKKLRRAGGRHKGPSAFTDEDREHFEFSLGRLISEAQAEQAAEARGEG